MKQYIFSSKGIDQGWNNLREASKDFCQQCDNWLIILDFYLQFGILPDQSLWSKIEKNQRSFFKKIQWNMVKSPNESFLCILVFVVWIENCNQESIDLYRRTLEFYKPINTLLENFLLFHPCIFLILLHQCFFEKDIEIYFAAVLKWCSNPKERKKKIFLLHPKNCSLKNQSSSFPKKFVSLQS